jgi:hypothetical protein
MILFTVRWCYLLTTSLMHLNMHVFTIETVPQQTYILLQDSFVSIVTTLEPGELR